MLRIVQHLIGQALFHHMTTLHHHQPIRQQAHHSQIMSNDDRRKPHLADQPAQQIQQARLYRHIQPAGGFVHEHEARPGDQIAGDLQALLHTARKGAGAVVNAVGGNLHPAQPIDRLRADIGMVARPHRHQAFAGIATGRDAHAQPVARILMHEGPIGTRKPAPFGLGHPDGIAWATFSIIHDLSPIGGQMACKAGQQRGFARAAFADDPQRLAREQLERHLRAADPPAMEPGNAPHRKQRRIRFHFGPNIHLFRRPHHAPTAIIGTPSAPTCPASRRLRQKSVSEQTNIRPP